jgi:hypothetical protein
MKKDEALHRILLRWKLQPESERAEANVASFAMQMSREYHFRCSGDRYQFIMGTLSAHLLPRRS